MCFLFENNTLIMQNIFMDDLITTSRAVPCDLVEFYCQYAYMYVALCSMRKWCLLFKKSHGKTRLQTLLLWSLDAEYKFILFYFIRHDFTKLTSFHFTHN